MPKYLAAHEVSVEDLISRKVFGHDLQLGFDKAMKLGLGKTLSFTDDLRYYVGVINQPYRERDFQYKGSGSWELVFISPLILLVDSLVKAARLDY
jgi:hypothetical protein